MWLTHVNHRGIFLIRIIDSKGRYIMNELKVGDKVYKHLRNSLAITIYSVERVTKTLAILSNGHRVKRLGAGNLEFMQYGGGGYSLYRLLTEEKAQAQARIDAKIKAFSQTSALLGSVVSWGKQVTNIARSAISIDDLETLNQALEAFVAVVNKNKAIPSEFSRSNN